MDTITLILSAVMLVMVLIVVFLMIRTYAGVHILATRNVEDPARMQDTLSKVSEAKTQVVGFFQTVQKFVSSVRSFMDRVNALFGRD